MELRLIRSTYTDQSTIGDLYVDGQWECYTLEDVIRRAKIKAETAIPQGRYPITLYDSPSQGAATPMLQGVPGFEYILIHSGNSKKDTEGCILVGQQKSANWISSSKAALAPLREKIQGAIRAGEPVWIEIEDAGAPVYRKRPMVAVGSAATDIGPVGAPVVPGLKRAETKPAKAGAKKAAKPRKAAKKAARKAPARTERKPSPAKRTAPRKAVKRTPAAKRTKAAAARKRK